MLTKVAIEKLRPNPFRRLNEYPIDREKVEALKSSIENSGFWRTIVGRPVADGHVEVAFGHHRLVALREQFGPEEVVEIIVQKLSDEQMLKMMANENLAEWGSNGWTEVETVRAVIDAHARGLISLPPAPAKTKTAALRYVPRDSLDHPYTKASVATFLGWTDKGSHGTLQPNDRCNVAIDAIDAIDEKLVGPADLRGLSRYKIHELVRGARLVRGGVEQAAAVQKDEAERSDRLAAAATTPARRAHYEQQAEMHRHQAKNYEADAVDRGRRFVDRAVGRFRKAEGGHEEVRELARAMAPLDAGKKEVPDVNGYADWVIKKLHTILNGDDDLSARLAIMAEFKAELKPEKAEGLCRAIGLLLERLDRQGLRVFGAGNGAVDGRHRPPASGRPKRRGLPPPGT
jgi:hypothetical protein